MIHDYLNGPRLLGSHHLSHLFFSTSLDQEIENGTGTLQDNDLPKQCDILIAATHYLGDGMALHNFANDFFSLLAMQVGNPDRTATLSELLSAEWEKRCGPGVMDSFHMLPHSLEDRLPSPGDKMKSTVGRVELENSQQKVIVSGASCQLT